MAQFFRWLLSILMAFGLGFSAGGNSETVSDSELKQKVQSHVDVIVDESAAIVDDVVEEIRKDERVQEAERFADDVKEIAENTREDIKAHFGDDDEEETEDEVKDEAEAAASEESISEESTSENE